LQEPVDQGRLAVVEVRDYGDVTKLIVFQIPETKARAPYGARDATLLRRNIVTKAQLATAQSARLPCS
jgi:hypothetical protein